MQIKCSKSDFAKQEPCWDSECDRLKKEKFKALRVFRCENNFQNLTRYKELLNRFKEVCRRKKLDYQKRNRDELTASRTNMSLFWRTVKKFKYKPKGPYIIKREKWVSYFKELLYIPHDGSLAENIDEFREDGPFNDIFNASFTMTELGLSMKLGKSGGPDGSIAEIIVNTINAISVVLLPFSNRILVLGQYPENRSLSILCPIHKTGSMSDPNNFIGVSLIDVLNKILTGMMYNRIYKWTEDNSKLSESQAGGMPLLIICSL